MSSKRRTRAHGTPRKAPPRPVRHIRLLVPAVVLAALFVFAAGGFFTAAGLEENDSFCASCHTQPEAAYYERTQAGTAVDMASAHHFTSSTVKCIDCHSQPGLLGRAGALSLGARDALLYVTHTAVQPATQTVPISDATCLACHQDTPIGQSFDNHFHRFLTRWQSMDPRAATCVTCHTAHTTDGDASIGFLQQQRTVQVCQQCHEALGARD